MVETPDGDAGPKVGIVSTIYYLDVAAQQNQKSPEKMTGFNSQPESDHQEDSQCNVRY